MSERARSHAMRVEELLIALKQAWPSLAEAERVPRADSSRLLARVVTLCVEEFYGLAR